MELVPVIISAGIGAAVSAIGATINHLITTAKHGERLNAQDKRMNSIETKLDNLGTTFVPRPELEAVMKNMQDSLNRIERWFQQYFLDKQK